VGDEVSELKRALLRDDYSRAEKLLRRARESGAISPAMASQISSYISMARWETGPENMAASRLKALAARL